MNRSLVRTALIAAAVGRDDFTPFEELLTVDAEPGG